MDDGQAMRQASGPVFEANAPHAAMLDIVLSAIRNHVVLAVAQLNLADRLAEGSSTAEEIADLESLDPDATFRLLRAGASFGLMTYDANKRFSSTPMLDTLRTSDPASMRNTVLSQLGRGFELPRSGLAESVRTGQPQAIEMLGQGLWDYYASGAGAVEAAAFAETMRLFSDTLVAEAVQLIDTREVSRAIDVGGGVGTLVHALMQANPELNGVVLDVAKIVPSAAARAEALGLSNRFEAIGGDFLDGVPSGDLMLLKWVVHDWPGNDAASILRNCRRALSYGGRLVLIEFVFDERTPAPFAASTDLSMLTVLGGRERSSEEYEALLEAAGFRNVRITPSTSTPYSFIEAETDD